MEYDIEINVFGDKFYFKKGTKILHREDGPAIERTGGNKEWWINGIRHREDGPALEYLDGYKEWFVNGQTHRTDGPAIEWADGVRWWYINGQRLPIEKEAILNQWWDNKNGI